MSDLPPQPPWPDPIYLPGPNQVGLPRRYMALPQTGLGRERYVYPPVVLPQASYDPYAIQPRPLVAAVVAVGGTAVVVAIGPIVGGFLTNPLNAAAQGIAAAENLYVDMVGIPGSTDDAAHGTTVILQPGQNYAIPPLNYNIVLRVNAATSGHAISGSVW